MTARHALSRLWSVACSLKLAIVLASLATLVTMAGSLVMHFNPGIFGDLDRRVFGDWLLQTGIRHPLLAGWLFVLTALVAALAVNTLCCFLDWLAHLGVRWRKSGEYLIHVGFVLIVAAYLWGAADGARHPGLAARPGQPVPLPHTPGVYLRLDAFEPVLGAGGRPVDMRSDITLLRGDRELLSRTLRLNHPLIWEDLVILPESFGQVPRGFLVRTGAGTREMRPGQVLRLPGGTLRVLAFHGDVAVAGERVLPRGEGLGNPAFLVEFSGAQGAPWRGWYLPAQGLPRPLLEAGVRLQPLRPLFETYSVLTVNRDPGARLAFVGATAMLVGVIFALASFYRKRARGDRPQIA